MLTRRERRQAHEPHAGAGDAGWEAALKTAATTLSDATTVSERKPNIPWRCHFDWHNWPKWSEPKEARVSSFAGSVVTIMVQSRTCRGCNRIEHRRTHDVDSLLP